MKHGQKGALGGLALTFLAIALVAAVGIGWMWMRGDNTVATNTTTNAGIPNTGYTYIISSSTPSTPSAPTPVVSNQPQTTTKTFTTYIKKTIPGTASSFTGFSGSTYHNSTYGLTLRLATAGYTTYMTAGGPAGLPGTAQIHFVAPGDTSDTFVIDVWSKQGWNYVRTQENLLHLNTTNIGEGTYLGENFTWIYSYTIFSHAAEVQSAMGSAVFQ